MKNGIKLLLLTTACTVCISCGSANEDTMETVSSTEATTETAPEVKTAQKIELSGNPEDSFVAEEDCYAKLPVCLLIRSGFPNILWNAETCIMNPALGYRPIFLSRFL